MAGAVKRTISLPRQLAAEAEEMARSEGKTVSAVVQDALREARARLAQCVLHNGAHRLSFRSGHLLRLRRQLPRKGDRPFHCPRHCSLRCELFILNVPPSSDATPSTDREMCGLT